MNLPVYRVYLARCPDYKPDNVAADITGLVDALDWRASPPVTEQQGPRPKAFLKPNLLMPRIPEHCVTTHPQVIAALAYLLIQAGYEVLIGDSPGGPFTPGVLRRLYETTGMAKAAASAGATLSYDVTCREVRDKTLPVEREFVVCDAMWQSDLLVNVCKLKTHGLTGLTAGAKNLFGCIAGLHKTEYHMTQPTVESFSDILVDIAKLMSPALSICDAILAMEGAGPSHGRPKALGLLLAATDPFALDYAVACLLGVGPRDFTTLAAALRRGYGPQTDDELEVVLTGSQPELLRGAEARARLASLRPDNFELLRPEDLSGLQGRGVLKSVLRSLQPFLRSRPEFSPDVCNQCRTCLRSCPVDALTLTGKAPAVDLSKCIRCYCCQELCPLGAVRISQPVLARLLYGR